MEYYGIVYERGAQQVNQDTVALQQVHTLVGEAVLALVCDGMGGMARGEVASGYVAERVCAWFHEDLMDELRGGYRKRHVYRSLSRTLFRTHEDLRQYGVRERLQSGTTLALLLLVEDQAMVCWLGDSMVYRISRGSRAVSERQGRGNQLTRCMGVGAYHAPSVSYAHVRRGDAYLLVSDGMTRCLRPEDYYHALAPARVRSGEDAQRSLRTLSEAARRRGEADNRSAVYVRC